MAKSAFYDATEEDSRPWNATETPRATAINEAAVAVAAGIQTATRASSPITAITVTPSTASISAGTSETEQLTTAPTPSGNGYLVTWSSSDETKATVDENGLVTAVAAGSATITATCVHDNSITDTCAVTVGA